MTKLLNSYLKTAVLFAFLFATQVKAQTTIKYVTPLGAGDLSGSSWGNASSGSHLQQLINTGGGGSALQIWIAKGSYIPDSMPNNCTSCGTDTRNYTYMLKSNVSLYGGFAGNEIALSNRNVSANTTILSGDLNNNDVNYNGSWYKLSTAADNAYHVLTALNVDSSTTIDGITISGGCASNNVTTINGIVLNKNSGGGLYAYHSNINLNNVNFINNAAYSSILSLKTAYGGAIFNSGGSPKITNVLFSANIAQGANGDPNVSFQGNNGDGGGNAYGGAFLNTGGGNPTLQLSVFSNNVSIGGDGSFSINSGGTGGGASGGAFANVYGNPYFTNDSFYNNSARGGYASIGTTGGGYGGNADGGGFYNGNSDLYFTSNGFQQSFYDTVLLKQVTFTNNNCYGSDGGQGGPGGYYNSGIYSGGRGGNAQGGGIKFYYGSLQMDLCNINNNKCIGGAGGLATGGTTTYQNLGGQSNGGGFYNSGSATISNTLISDNSVTGGNSKNASFTYQSFSPDNGAGSGTGGGVSNYGTINCLNVKVNNNSAISGVGSSSYNSYGVGGGIYMSTGYNTKFINCTITNNRATRSGGGVYSISGSTAENYQITNCTIAGNYSDATNGIGDFGLYDNYSTITLTNSIVYGSISSSPKNIFNYSLVGGFYYLNAGNSQTVSTNSLNTLFSSAGDYSLDDNSLAINKGNPDTTGLGISSTDLAGNNRIVGSVIDLGAYENQNASSPSVLKSFTPTSATSGTLITIKGTNLLTTSSINLGGVSVSSFSVLNDSIVTAVVGNGLSGSLNVSTNGGTASLAGFTFLPTPKVISFDPSSDSYGATINIRGTNFIGVIGVSFGGTPAHSFSVVNDSTITAILGSGASGNVSVTNNNGTGSLDGFTYVPTFAWAGTNSSDWNTPSNWIDGVVPTSTSNVIISSSTPHQLVLSGDAVANSFQLDGSINLNGHSLTISGALSGSGTIEGSGTSTLSLSGSNDSIGNLKVSSGDFSVSGAMLYVTNQLTVSGGTLNTGGNLVLGSTATGSAIVNYPIGGTINGNVSVLRFIAQDQGAAFRDLGVCVTGGTVADLSTQTYSYAGGAWSSSLSSGTSLVPGTGYRAQVNTASGPVTLGNIGSLVSGNVPAAISQGANAYSFVANPYLGQLDFTKVTSSNLQAGFWYLDPTNLSSDGYQGYVFYGVLTGASNTYNGGITPSNYIQPGQGFFVQNQNNGSASSLTFKESAIDNSQSQYNVFGKTALNRIATGLFTGGKNVDGAVVVFNNSFSGGLDQYDATKFSNHGENLTFTVAGTDLCTNAWSLPTVTDVLTLHLYNLKASTPYTLKLDASQFVGNGLVAYLKDNVTSTKTLLSGANNEVAFTTGTDASVYASRYSIVFEAGALPVKNISLTASKMGNNQVAIKWSTTSESNIGNYKIERSTNGTSFTELATVSPSTAHNYSYIDATPSGAGVGAGVYYRIKVTDNTGAISYSAIAKLTNNHSPLTTIKVYPNPVSGNSFKVELGTSGKYTISVVNMLGQKVYSTVINHTTAPLETVSLAKQVAAGNYRLIAISEEGTTNSTTLTFK